MRPDLLASLFVISGLSLLCLQQPATRSSQPAPTIQQTTPPATNNNYEVKISGQTPVANAPVCREVVTQCIRYLPNGSTETYPCGSRTVCD